MSRTDTVAAIATAAGRGGIGVVRASGPEVRSIARRMTGKDLEPRVATLAKFQDSSGVIDEGIALYFPAPDSYTGEDVLELQGHGGPAVLRLILCRCLQLGARPAQPGEFTQRAFLNGKLDLAQAESVADLIDASSEAAARGAMRSLSGEFSAEVQAIVNELVSIRVRVEASLDFPEEDIDIVGYPDLAVRVESTRLRLTRLLGRARQGTLLRDGARVVFLGQPNVGKSSLMNRLAEEDVAIVTEIPGTTRDTLRHEFVINGVPVHVTDTAGLREANDPIEAIGIERAWRESKQADVALLVVDAREGISTTEEEILAKLPETQRKVLIFNKIDTCGELPGVRNSGTGVTVWVSAKSGAGIDLLKGAILEALGWQPSDEGQFIARERHVHALLQADSSLREAQRTIDVREFFAEELRIAQRSLGAITGEFSADDLLGEIFSHFCIGK
jgi:tRNA modification GTPase